MSYSLLSAASANEMTKMKTAATISASATAETILNAIEEHGVTKGGTIMMKAEAFAAEESIRSGLYIIWMPLPSCKLTHAASEDIRNGISQCCRVGSESVCMCGHPLKGHNPVNVSKKGGYIRPPTCRQHGCHCKGFAYCPIRPEECGQWWLPRRRDFDIETWIARVQKHPEEYCCIGCEQKLSDHETIFETKADRVSRGAPVDERYLPLEQHGKIQEMVFPQRQLGPSGAAMRLLPNRRENPRIQNGMNSNISDSQAVVPLRASAASPTVLLEKKRTSTPHRFPAVR